MPELPEVQTIVNTLSPRILGQRIECVELRRADILDPQGFDFVGALCGKSITHLDRRGKRLVFTLDDSNRFYVHLGMSGRLTIDPKDLALPKHTHLTIRYEGFELRFRDPRRFGGVWWMGSRPDDDTMGPEPLTIRPACLYERFQRTSRAIKNALLDQHVVAGLGNIYVDESLFAAGLHPLTPADRLSKEQVERLTRAIKATLRKALRHRGSTLRDYVDADGGEGAFQVLHRVYDRGGKPCRKCRTAIKRIVLGGRSTCFCPRCQAKTNAGGLAGRNRPRRRASASRARG